MPVTSLRFKDEQYDEIKETAAFYGVSVTTFMRQTILDRMEDEQDYRDAVASVDEGSNNPRAWGKALEGDRGAFWRYRVGGFRIIADIQDNQFIVLVAKAAKRNDVYRD
ncbi:DUF6290 family protein [Lapidilactobacillus mulanensis]|uniref:DUF6290 family protein n=1 Tax=Lapidilactobacillus mulanensis TaxID=2485999 RepID=A0ABW4DL41_9LACO|nr:DUF6290 family protein [Lapidilactobacillus mulanensis]